MTTTKKGQMLHKKSNVFGRVPSASTLDFGEIAVNYNEKEPFLAIKTSGETNNFEVVKISSDKIIEQKINDAVDKVGSELNELADVVSQNELVTADSLTELNDAVDKVSLKLNELDDVVSQNELVTADSLTELNDAINYVDSKFSDYATSAATSAAIKAVNDKAEALYDTVSSLTETINNKVSNAYTYKGSKKTFNELPTEGNNKGDVWNVEGAYDNIPAGTNYAWDGTQWDALAGIVDLTIYATSADTSSAIKAVNDKAEALSNKLIKDYATSASVVSAITELNGAVDKVGSDLNKISDIVSQNELVTADSLTELNGAVDKVSSELNELSDIVSQNELVTADSLTELNDAINYVDSKFSDYATSADTSSAIKAVSAATSAIMKAVNDKAEKSEIPTESTIINWGFTKNQGTVTNIKANGVSLAQNNGEVNITAADLGIASALKYCGITTTKLTDGDTTNPVIIDGKNHTASQGCVVFYEDSGNTKEFVFNGTKWELLGSDLTYKVIQNAVSSPSANGNAVSFIDTISQDANGVITATKKNVDMPIVKGDAEHSAVLKGETTVLGVTYKNEALNEGCVSLGANSKAGLKGYYFTYIDFNTNKIWLHNKQFTSRTLGSLGGWKKNSVSDANRCGWAKDDVISFTCDGHYDNSATIVDVLDNVITVDKLPFTLNDVPSTIISIEAANNKFDECSVFCVKKYNIGTVELGGNAFAIGTNTQASNAVAYAEGYNTVAYGKYSHAEGNETKAGYNAHAEGYLTKALGARSHAEGIETTAEGNASHAEGRETTAIGNFSHAEGYNTTANGGASHAEGSSTEAGENAHSEGLRTKATGDNSHAEGQETQSVGNRSHAEGKLTVASGDTSHAEGQETQAIGMASHAEGVKTKASEWASHVEGYNCETGGNAEVNDKEADEDNIDGQMAHAEGNSTIARGNASHSEGTKTIAVGKCSHAEGIETKAKGNASHAEGDSTTATGVYSHAEGQDTQTIGIASHAEGYFTRAMGSNSHAEGNSTRASGDTSHAEGQDTQTIGIASHAEGYYSQADGFCSHAEGNSTTASADASHAEGFKTNATGASSHAEGNSTTASGADSHAEGSYTTASGGDSHAEGNKTTASGEFSHAEGFKTNATGASSHAEGEGNFTEAVCSHIEGYSNNIYKDNTDSSHAEGENNIVNNGAYASHVEGEYNRVNNTAEHASGRYNQSIKSDDASQATHFSIGIGTSDTDRKNAFEVKQDGKHYIYGIGGYDGTNPTTINDLKTVIDNKANESEVLKTTPQSLTDDEKNQVLSNLGLTDVVHNSQFTEEVSNINKTIEDNEEVVAVALNKLNDELKNISVNTSQLLVNITYSELVNLRDNGELIPGQQYRITDYVTTTTEGDTQSANHQFDIIVTADDVNVLNENARAIQHTTDENDYFSNSDLNAWELKYCLDNDTSRFAWADDSDNGKGVIYFMKDEFNNECPYDFKNIMFSNPLKENDNIWYFSFGNAGHDYSLMGLCYGNTVKEYLVENKMYLNRNLLVYGGYNNFFDKNCCNNFLERECYNNSFGINCYNNFLDKECHNNSFGINCYNNFLGKSCHNNSFGNDSHTNSFGDNCYDNEFGKECCNNEFGKECYYNSFKDRCMSNVFDAYCKVNSFGINCYNNVFKTYCIGNMFGNFCCYNSFGMYCTSNVLRLYCNNINLGDSCMFIVFGIRCEDIILGSSKTELKSYCRHIIFDEGNKNIRLNCTETTSNLSFYQNVRVSLGTNNSSHITINDTNVNQLYETCYKPSNSQTITI